MSIIKKTFESFVNEELSRDTNISAANKLNSLGHNKRAEALRDYATTKDEKAIITINNIQYEMTESNIRIDDKFNTMELILSNIEEIRDKRPITIKYKGESAEVLGIEGIKDRKNGKILFDYVKKIIEKNVDKHPQLEDLLSKISVNNFYR